jgi:hypothetical protein
MVATLTELRPRQSLLRLVGDLEAIEERLKIIDDRLRVAEHDGRVRARSLRSIQHMTLIIEISNLRYDLQDLESIDEIGPVTSIELEEVARDLHELVAELQTIDESLST